MSSLRRRLAPLQRGLATPTAESCTAAGAAAAATVSDEDVGAYRRDGAVVIRNLLTLPELHRLSRQQDIIFSRGNAASGKTAGHGGSPGSLPAVHPHPSMGM